MESGISLVPITQNADDHRNFDLIGEGGITLTNTLVYYEMTGYKPPWISYFAQSKNGQLIGSGAFKGAPKDGTVEIAYQVFKKYQNQGFGTQICAALTRLAFAEAPEINILACTLPENNYSTRILEKNGFYFAKAIEDPEEGLIWQWLKRNI